MITRKSMDSIRIEHTNHDVYFSLAQENLMQAEKVYQNIIKSGRAIPFQHIYVHTDNDPETSAWLSSRLWDMKKYLIASIVFSALTAEAFINYYALSKKGAEQELEEAMNELKKYEGARFYCMEELDSSEMQEQYKLPIEYRTTVKKWVELKDKEAPAKGIDKKMSGTVRKWIEIPNLYTNSYIVSGLNGSLIYHLDNLFKLRNDLVHHKATVALLSLDEPNLESAEDKTYVSLKEAQWAIETIVKVFKSLQYIDKNVDLTWLSKPM